MIILGAGMAGLLAASVLRNRCERIIEAQPALPANHSAVLRFKSSIIGDTTNIPFRKVKAIKAVEPWLNPVADAMAYSEKSNGNYQLRSIATANNMVVERYVAPPDFTEQLAAAAHCPISFGQPATKEGLQGLGPRGVTNPVISTLPMPVLMELLDYQGTRPEFKSVPGINVTARIHDCDMYCSLYIPDPAIGPYRISINGDIMIAEVALVGDRDREDMRYGSLNSNEAIQGRINIWRQQAFEALGIHQTQTYDHSFARQRFQKILPIDEEARSRFIMFASDNFGIYSLGRFATWRPALLLDDLIQDIRLIDRLIKHGNYEQRKGAASNV